MSETGTTILMAVDKFIFHFQLAKKPGNTGYCYEFIGHLELEKTDKSQIKKGADEMGDKKESSKKIADKTPISCIRISGDQLTAVSCGKPSLHISVWSRSSPSKQFQHVEKLFSETGQIIDVEMSQDASTLICSTSLNKLVIWKRNLNAKDFFTFNPKRIIKT